MSTFMRPDDHRLLKRFVLDADQAAFTELVGRYLGFVRACAGRQVPTDLVPDVCQAVFLVLARKAESLGADTVLSAWLFRTTRFIASRLRRSNLRRELREHTAHEMMNRTAALIEEGHQGSEFSEVGLPLDDALAVLTEKDRLLVLTRFFDELPFEKLGAKFGLRPDTARKRVERALDRMRVYLLRRGARITAAGLTTRMSEAVSAQALVPGEAAAIVSRLRNISAVPIGTSGGLMERWVEGALTDWRRFLLQQWGLKLATRALVCAAGLVILLLLDRFNRPHPSDSRVVGSLAAIQTPDPGPRLFPQEVRQAAPAAPLSLRFLDARTSVPLPGAEVVVETWDQQRVLRVERLRSGTRGECEIQSKEAHGRLLRVWASAAGHVPVVMDWHIHELQSGFPPYDCLLEPGRTISGSVFDEAGLPVTQARIRFQEPGLDTTRRENIGFHPATTEVSTDADGRFRSDQMPGDWLGSPLGISIRHPDFVGIDYQVAGPAAWTTNHALVLNSGFALRGQILDLQDVPVAAATVRARRGESWPEENCTTDSEGRFVFAHLPPGSFPFQVKAAGYESHEGLVVISETNPWVRVNLRPGPLETLTKKPTRPTQHQELDLEVMDARTGAAIPRFRVLLATDGGGQPLLLGEGIGGSAHWTVDASYYETFHLEIEAPNYLPRVSDKRSVTATTQRFEARLEPGADVSGTVVLPDGQPAALARVALAGPGRGLPMLQPGVPSASGNGARTVLSREDGSFQLSRSVGDHRLQVIHAEGCRYLELNELTGGKLRLEPWSVVEGQVHFGSDPVVPNSLAVVGLTRRTPNPNQASDELDFHYTCQLGSDLRFRFDHVPPGELEIRVSIPVPRKLIRWTQAIQVTPGSHLRIDSRRPE